MGASTGAAATGAVMAVIGVAVMLFGVMMFLSGPLFTTSSERDNGIGGIGGSSTQSATINVTPVLGLVLVVIGAVILLAGLKGTMDTFERGKEREEGTRHHLTIKKE